MLNAMRCLFQGNSPQPGAARYHVYAQDAQFTENPKKNGGPNGEPWLRDLGPASRGDAALTMLSGGTMRIARPQQGGQQPVSNSGAGVAATADHLERG